jgi:Sec-independent protein translocase protein TatA
LAPPIKKLPKMNINLSEILVIALVTLLLFGPDNLPQLARQLGKLAADWRKVSNSVRREWYNTIYPPAEEVKRGFKLSTSSITEELRDITSEVLSTQQPNSTPNATKARDDTERQDNGSKDNPPS